MFFSTEMVISCRWEESLKMMILQKGVEIRIQRREIRCSPVGEKFYHHRGGVKKKNLGEKDPFEARILNPIQWSQEEGSLANLAKNGSSTSLGWWYMAKNCYKPLLDHLKWFPINLNTFTSS